ncbi:MAG: hypothetical protein AAGH15_05755 [Myxococcota bacterium]
MLRSPLVTCLSLILAATGCSTRVVVTPGADDGGAEGDGAVGDGAGARDAGLDGATEDAPFLDPLTLRFTDAELAPLVVNVLVISSAGSRAVVDDRVVLTSAEQAEGADVLAAAEGFMPFGWSQFGPEDWGALPTLDGDPALALLPRFITDPVRVELRRDGERALGFVYSIPVGYGGGASDRVQRTRLQRDAAVEALVVRGPACGQRLDVDLMTAPDPLVVDLDDPRFVDLPCEERSVEVRDPSGARLFVAPIGRTRAFSPLTGTVDACGEEHAGGRGGGVLWRPPAEGVAMLSVDLVYPRMPAPRREHPGIAPLTGARVTGSFLLDETRDAGSEAHFDGLEAVPGTIVLPEPEAMPLRRLAMGLDYDPGRGTGIASLPDEVAIEPAPADGRSPFLLFERGAVVMPPETPFIRFRRLLQSLAELPSAEVVDEERIAGRRELFLDETAIAYIAVADIAYRPFATYAGVQLVYIPNPFDEPLPIVEVPVELLPK